MEYREPANNNMKLNFMHLTNNYSVNKTNKNFVSEETLKSNAGSKR